MLDVDSTKNVKDNFLREAAGNKPVTGENVMKTQMKLPRKLFSELNKFDRQKLNESKTILRDINGNGTLGTISNGEFKALDNGGSNALRVESSMVDFSDTVPRFDLEGGEWEQYLKENGYVVIKNIIGASKVEELRNDVYSWCENHPSSKNIFKRDDPETWRESFLGSPETGIVWASGAGQADHMWKIRGDERVQEAFRRIWKTEKLLTSFDVFNLFRPWGYDENWITKGGWFHLDQNGNNPKRKGFQCVQGLVNLYDANETTGGLTLIPKSHLQFEDILTRMNYPATAGDFIPIHFLDQILQPPFVKKLVNAKAGDLCLWDSRTVHCNSPGITPAMKPENGWRLLRICLYVCMTPFDKATEEVLKKREEAYRTYCGTSHWPHLFVARPCGLTKEGEWNTVPRKFELTPEIEMLIAGKAGCTNLETVCDGGMFWCELL